MILRNWVLGAFAASAGLCGSASAATLRFDLPEIGLGIFGVAYSADYFSTVGEIRNGRITASRMHLEFNTEHNFGNLADAATIAIDFQAPIVNIDRIWTVSGADLGWSGTGQRVGDISTDFLNDDILDFTGFPDDAFALWFVRIFNTNDASPALGGAFSGSYIEIDVEPVPEPTTGLALLALCLPVIRRR